SDLFFDVLGVKPAAGRFFQPDELEAGAPTVAVISYGFWQRQYGGARSALGATLSADSHPVPIVGVLPTNMECPAGTEVVVPLGMRIRRQRRAERAARAAVLPLP